jgi:hypothetical protein
MRLKKEGIWDNRIAGRSARFWLCPDLEPMKRRLQTLGAKVLQEWLVLIAIESADE